MNSEVPFSFFDNLLQDQAWATRLLVEIRTRELFFLFITKFQQGNRSSANAINLFFALLISVIK